MFRRRRFLTGADAKELGWFIPAGTAMTDADWDDSSALAVAIYLDGSDSPDRAADGSLLLDDDFYLLVNAWWEPVTFTIPDVRTPAWRRRPTLADRAQQLRRHDRRGEPAVRPGWAVRGGRGPAGRPGHRRPPLPHRAPRPLRLAAADSGSVPSHIAVRGETENLGPGDL